MTLRTLGASAFLAIFLVAVQSRADSAAVFPFETVNTSPEIAKAVTLTIAQHLESRGFTILKGNTLSKETSVPPTVPPSVPPSDTSSTTETTQPETPTNEATDTSGIDDSLAADTGDSQGPAETPAQSDQLSQEAMSVAAVGAGCRFYLTGSLVQLGEQITITVDIFLADGARIAGKKIISPSERALPGAIQTISAAVADEMLRYQQPLEETAVAPSETPVPVQTKNDSGFQKNFGLMLSQTFSLSDDMYSFISFYFNGRFEFNRLLMTTNAGFAIGNRDPGEGFHFALNISLSAYLLKKQISPYLGGGFGFFIGNRMVNRCTYEYDEYYGYEYETCEDDEGLVGWDVFPVVGLEVLRTMFMRVHLEGRYLVTFNGYGSWGHGPAVLMGIAF